MANAKTATAPPAPRAAIRPREVCARMARPGATTMPGSAPKTGERCCAIPPRCPAKSAIFWKPRTPMPTRCSPRRAPCSASSCARCARAFARTTASRRRRTGPSATTRASAMAASIASIAGARASGGKETVLIDGDARAADRPFFHLGAARHSPDHRKFAWSSDDKGSEMHAIRVRDIAGRSRPRRLRRERDRRRRLDPQLQRVSLCAAGREPPPVARHAAPARRAVQAEDVCVFEEADPAWFLTLSADAARAARLHPGPRPRRLGGACRRSRGADRRPPRLIAPRRPGLRYQPMDHGDVFYIKTNSGGARDFQIVTAPSARAGGGELARRSCPPRTGA